MHSSEFYWHEHNHIVELNNPFKTSREQRPRQQREQFHQPFRISFDLMKK